MGGPFVLRRSRVVGGLVLLFTGVLVLAWAFSGLLAGFDLLELGLAEFDMEFQGFKLFLQICRLEVQILKGDAHTGTRLC